MNSKTAKVMPKYEMSQGKPICSGKACDYYIELDPYNSICGFACGNWSNTVEKGWSCMAGVVHILEEEVEKAKMQRDAVCEVLNGSSSHAHLDEFRKVDIALMERYLKERDEAHEMIYLLAEEFSTILKIRCDRVDEISAVFDGLKHGINQVKQIMFKGKKWKDKFESVSGDLETFTANALVRMDNLQGEIEWLKDQLSIKKGGG